MNGSLRSLFFNFCSICCHAARVFAQRFKVISRQLVANTSHSAGVSAAIVFSIGTGEAKPRSRDRRSCENARSFRFFYHLNKHDLCRDFYF